MFDSVPNSSKDLNDGEHVEKDLEYMDTDQSTRDDAVSIVHRVLREHGVEPYADSDISARRPPLKGVSKVITAPKLIEITNKAKREVELSSQIDDLIEKRREIRRELVSGTDRNIVHDSISEMTGLPPRGPRVISDVQLIPPRLGEVPMETTSVDETVGSRLGNR